MILPDETPQSPTKSRTGPPSEAPEQEDAVLPPPAYPGPPPARYSYQNGYVDPQTGSSRTPLLSTPPEQYTLPQHHHPVPHRVERVEPAGKRFLKALGIALLIYLTLISLTRTVVAANWRHRSPRKWEDSPDQDHGQDGGFDPQIPLPTPSEGKILHCTSAANAMAPSSSADRALLTSFLLPLSADLLYILGRGDLTHGSIILSPVQDSSIPDGNIRVDITPHYNSMTALRAANLCRVERSQGQQGIAILTPSSWYPSNELSFTIEVHLPASSNKPLHVNAFETRLPLFHHTIVDLKEKVTFGSIDLKSQNMAVDCKYLAAQKASISTTNGQITGNYDVTRSLVLQTTNQVIATSITLHHDTGSEEPTSLTMNTANSALSSFITLHSASPASASPLSAFSISAHTQNGLLDVHISAQPLNSTLALEARTTNAPASVVLAPAYEGPFELGTTHGQSLLDIDERAADPAGLGRARVWAITKKMPRYFGGWLSWGRPAPAPGAGGRRGRGGNIVSVSSTNAPVKLVA